MAHKTESEIIKGILWIRTLKNFLEKVEVDGKKVSRFTPVK